MKFYGKIGFVDTVGTAPGVQSPTYSERPYYGDVLSKHRRWASSDDSTNDTLEPSNRISVVADSYIVDNVSKMRYVVWNGKWKIDSFDVEWPRVILELGGVYNGL